MGSLIPLFQTSDDISGFQSPGRQPYSHLAEVIGQVLLSRVYVIVIGGGTHVTITHDALGHGYLPSVS